MKFIAAIFSLMCITNVSQPMFGSKVARLSSTRLVGSIQRPFLVPTRPVTSINSAADAYQKHLATLPARRLANTMYAICRTKDPYHILFDFQDEFDAIPARKRLEATKTAQKIVDFRSKDTHLTESEKKAYVTAKQNLQEVIDLFS